MHSFVNVSELVFIASFQWKLYLNPCFPRSKAIERYSRNQVDAEFHEGFLTSRL